VVGFFVAVISFIIISYIYRIDFIDYKQNLLVRLLISLVILFVTYTLTGNKVVYDKINKCWKINYKIIFYLFLILFILRHFDSYEINLVTLLFFPILVSPQLVSGFFMLFVRI